MMSFKIGFLGLLLVLANNVMGAQVVLSPTRYDVGFEVDYDAELLRGTARIAVQNPSTESVRQASLLLYRLLRVKTVRDDQGKELAFSQTVVAFEDFGKQQVNQILVTLPEPLAPGAQTAIAKYTELISGPIRVYHLPGDELGAAGVARAAEQSLGMYTRWFGPLRESTGLTFIEIPDGWGSQADVTTIIQSAAAFKDPQQHREVYHEISHLWNVPPTDRPSPRWNEGQASFLEYLVTQEVTGKPLVDARANQLIDWLRTSLPTHEAWRKVPLVDYGRARLTDLSYSVGAVYFDLLYRLAGRETFNKIIGGFATEFGTRGGSTKDLVDVVCKTTKVDLSQLNNDWIFTTAWADRVEHSASIQELEAYYRRRQGGRE